MPPKLNSDYPSFWSGVAAASYPFEDVADYARWACMLLERGHDGMAVRRLAGMEDETNLFVLREWHAKALLDLKIEAPEGEAARAAHARGLMDEFLEGRHTDIDLLQALRDIQIDAQDSRLEPFYILNCAWWDFEDADWGIKSRDEIPGILRQECISYIETHQAEHGGADQLATAPESKAE